MEQSPANLDDDELMSILGLPKEHNLLREEQFSEKPVAAKPLKKSSEKNGKCYKCGRTFPLRKLHRDVGGLKICKSCKPHLNIPGIIVSFILWFAAFLPVINQLFEPQYRPMPRYMVNVDITITLVFCGTGLMLFIRSFLPSLGFFRGALTVIGSFFMFTSIVIVFFMSIKHGLPGCGTLIGTLFPGLVGAIMVVFGFKPKKGFIHCISTIFRELRKAYFS